MKNSILALLTFTLILGGCSDSENFGSPYDRGGYSVNGDVYNQITENPFLKTIDSAISTFSIDADGGSYLNSIRYLNEGNMPPADAVRSEEFVNYFKYNALTNFNGTPIAIDGEIADCPWNKDNDIIFLKMSGQDIAEQQLPNCNFVFLIDVSGSMSSPDKLGLIQSGLSQLVDHLDKNDYVSIVTYAGSNKTVLNPTSGDNKSKIKSKIYSLSSGGGTNGAAGINTAYDLIKQNFKQGANNRVILCSDGDFNVGVTSHDKLTDLIEEKRKTGVYLITVGVGHSNLNDANMEQIANHGNGNYEYIANEDDAKTIFNDGFKKFFTAAEDVKVQIEFNPNTVEEYRLLGYENRVLDATGFDNDAVDAGEISVGQTIVAMYEIVPAKVATKKEPAFTFSVRYKDLAAETSELIEINVENGFVPFSTSSSDFQFACGVSAFSQLMRDGKYTNDASYDKALEWVQNANLAPASAQLAQLEDAILRAKGL